MSRTRGHQAPAAEPELAVERPETQRDPRGLPDVGCAVQTRGLVVARERVRVAGQGHRGFQGAGEDEPLRQHLDDLASRRDAESLQRGREVDPGHRTFRQLGEQLVLPRLRHRAHLAHQRSLAVVDELPTRELGRVGPPHPGQEGALQRGAVVANRELGERHRQVDTAEQVLGLRLRAERLHQRHGLDLEVLGRRERQAGEVGLEPGKHSGVIQSRLRQVEATVDVHHRGLETRRRDDTTVLVRPLDERVDQRDAQLPAQNGREAFLPTLFAASGEPELPEESLLLSASKRAADVFELEISHDNNSFRLMIARMTDLPLPEAQDPP